MTPMDSPVSVGSTSSPTPPPAFRGAGRRATGVLILLVIAMGGIGVWGILGARSEARRELDRELRLETEARARAVEAAFASLRGDILFLTQAPPIRDLPRGATDPDPLRRRWSRIDSEASLLLFLEAHPEVERLSVRTADATRLVVGRRDGVPVLLPPDPVGRREDGGENGPGRTESEGAGVPDSGGETTGRFAGPYRVLGEWPIGDGVFLDLRVSIPDLLRLAVPHDPENVQLLPAESLPTNARSQVPSASMAQGEVETPSFVHRAVVRIPSWSPPLELGLLYADPETARAAGLFRLVGRFRTTYLLLLALATMALYFGVLAVREVRHGAELEAFRQHEARIHDLERQVFHSERLASVGRLAAGMAHEINNPLEGLSSYLTLLRDEIDDGSQAKAREYLARAREGLERVAAVTRQVLVYSDPGRTPHEPVDIVRILRETAGFLESQPPLSAGGIEVEAGGEAVVVPGNSVTLGQLFLNLLLNAAEASADGSMEREAGDPIEVRVRREGNDAIVAVRDHGPGIDPDSTDRLFEPFYSGKGSTGLGLSVCYGIVQDHRGEITARNHEEGGAVFTVRLPTDSEGGEPT